MAAMTSNQRQPDASAAKPVASEVLAGSKPRSRVILAIDLGQKTGWALCNHDGAIASGVEELRHGRFEGGVPMAQVIGGAR